jgi:ABC-type multidrug transport system ATPase subunit
MDKEARKKQIQELLIDLNMMEFKDRKIKYLSGGERRKVAVALAFIGNPDIIFLDEPSSVLTSTTISH